MSATPKRTSSFSSTNRRLCRLRQRLVVAGEAFARRLSIAVDAAHVDDDDSFWPQAHRVQNGSLHNQIGGAAGDQFGAGRVQDDVLGGVEGEAQIEGAGDRADLSQLGGALLNLAMELRHVRVRRIRSQLGRDAVHRDLGFRQVREDIPEVGQAHAEMGAVLPAPAVVASQFGPGQWLDDESEAHGARTSFSGLRRMVYNPVAVLRAKYSTRGLKRQIVGSVVISLFVALFALIAAVLPPAQADGLTPGYWEQTPLPQTGLATFYAPGMMEHVLDVRDGYGQMLRCPECVGTVALLRAGDIGRKVWLQPPGGEKIGPFLVIDCARQVDVWPLVDRNWVVDVSYELGELWGMNRPLDDVTVLADPSDESYSGVTTGPQRAPTPFYVPPGQLVLSAPTPTPAVTPTPWQPTPWPTRLPVGLQPDGAGRRTSAAHVLVHAGRATAAHAADTHSHDADGAGHAAACYGNSGRARTGERAAHSAGHRSSHWASRHGPAGTGQSSRRRLRCRRACRQRRRRRPRPPWCG